MKCPPVNLDSAATASATAHACGREPQAPDAPGEDAESGNTASHTCIGDQEREQPEFQVLWQGMDTLELSYPGQISQEADDELNRLKVLAQSARPREQAAGQLKLGERVFEVGDRGGGRHFAYLLRHPDMRIAVSSGNPTYVFSFKGRPLVQVSTKAWYTALEKVGIENFRWHDLRHTWASWHVQQGTPLFALQELGGWESSEMVRRYAHLAAEHLAPYADRLCALRVVAVPGDGTNPSQGHK